jgi:PspAB-like protein
MSFFKRLRRSIGNNVDIQKRQTTKSDSDAIFSLSSAYITLESRVGLKSTGRCAICVKNVNTSDFNEMQRYIQNFLSTAVNTDFDISFHTSIDNYGYFWVVLSGKTIEGIVAAINAVGDTINEKGFSNQLLAAVFELTNGYNTLYLIYNYKIDKFYPFAPIGRREEAAQGQKRRNNEEEIKIMEAISNEIPFEKNLSFWYPIWDLPI